MTFTKLTIRDVPLEGKTVLVRADYNVPLNKDGTIRDDLRVRASIPTIEYLLKNRCKVVIVSHLGRPTTAKEPEFSLEPVAIRLAELLDQPVSFVENCYGDAVKQAVKKATLGSVTLLQNVRYYAEEEANDELFAKKIVQSVGAKLFVQDGFGVVHRAHATTDAITHYAPSVSGLLLEREYKTITDAMENPKRPLVAVMGGAKVSDKIGVIEQFVGKADTILVGGAMANTFLDYKGLEMGASMVEAGQQDIIRALYEAATAKRPAGVDEFIVLPQDVAIGVNVTEGDRREVVMSNRVGASERVLDIGDKTIEQFVKIVEKAGTVIWNGTLGYAELPEFAHGSARLALALATNPGVTSIIGGGDTADFVNHWAGDNEAPFTHVSTGGGASLELMAGNILPGVSCLLDAPR